MGRQARASGSKSSLEVPGRGDAGGREDLSHLCWGGMQGIGGAGWAESALSWLNFLSLSFLMLGAIVFSSVSKLVVLMWLVTSIFLPQNEISSKSVILKKSFNFYLRAHL